MKSNKTNKIPYAIFSGLVGTSLTLGAGNLPAKAVDEIQLSSNHQVIEKMLRREAETVTRSETMYHTDGWIHTDSNI